MVVASINYLEDTDYLEKIAVRASQYAAIRAFDVRGRGDVDIADKLAVNAMREVLNSSKINGHIAVCEGVRDAAPMLGIGERVGIGGQEVDIVADPLEGTNILAHYASGSMSTIAISHHLSFMRTGDLYMDKIAIGFDAPNGIISLDDPVEENLNRIAEYRNKKITDITCFVLNRDRHTALINKIRKIGCMIKLINDGDLGAIMQLTNVFGSVADLYIGIGGAPEGLLAAAFLKVSGGQFYGRLLKHDDLSDKIVYSNQYSIDDLIIGDVIFAATGVTSGEVLGSVEHNNTCYKTHSVIANSIHKEIQTRTTIHYEKY